MRRFHFERRVFRTAPDSGYARVVPLGGNSVVVANLELRFRSPVLTDLVQFTVFADAGRVTPGVDVRLDDLRVTPGLGVRVASPVGPLRLDVGYNPYDLPAGAAYFDAPLDVPVAPLYCVSPGNVLPVSDVDGAAVQAEGPCPGSFRPAPARGLLRRLAFNFSIGQAF